MIFGPGGSVGVIHSDDMKIARAHQVSNVMSSFEQLTIPIGTQRLQTQLLGKSLDIAITDSYNKAMKVTVADAKNKLPKLIKAVENGESVTICRRGRPVADIVRTKQPTRKKRKLGTLRGKIQILDPHWWKPMTDEEAEAFAEGRG